MAGPTTEGLTFTKGDYTYTLTGDSYRMFFQGFGARPVYCVSVKATDKTKTAYEAIECIFQYDGTWYYVADYSKCYMDCANLVTPPTIDNTQVVSSDRYWISNVSGSYVSLRACFLGCVNLVDPPVITDDSAGNSIKITSLWSCFQNCASLTTPPIIPSYVIGMQACFAFCRALTSACDMSEHSDLHDIQECYKGCYNLTTVPGAIPNGVSYMDDCFAYCESLTGEIAINASPQQVSNTFTGTQKAIWLTGSSTKLNQLANTATNNNVFVGQLPLSYDLSVTRVASNGATTEDTDGNWFFITLAIDWIRLPDNSLQAIVYKYDGATKSITWYEDTGKTTQASLPNYYPGVSPITLYAWQQADAEGHNLSVVIRDVSGSGQTITIDIPPVFRTMDVAAGGRSVAFFRTADTAKDRILEVGGSIEAEGEIVSGSNIASARILTDDNILRALYQSDGVIREVADLGNSNGNVSMGHGGYADGIGQTNIWGNKVYLNSNSGVYFNQHSTPIGSRLSGNSTASVSNGTAVTKVADVVTLPPGSWIVSISVRFPSNATGTRAMNLQIETTNYGESYAAAATGSGTIALTGVATVSSTSNIDVNLGARQNSGSAMTITYYWSAMRIC